MKKNIVGVFIALLMIPCLSFAAIEEHYQENAITIQKAGAFDSKKKVKIRIGDKIRFVINIYEDVFFDQTIISANAKIDNASDQKVKAIYSISFHDKNGKLVGCVQGSWELSPDEDINYGSGLVYTDSKSIATITSYKIKTLVLKSKKN